MTRVLDAGAEIVGKTACEYFCLSGGSHTNAHGPTHNPHRHGWSAGGSSSGSAVAVATGEADMALGADQAGSIRMPASFSGVVGLKPTYSLVPYTGIAPIETVIDHVGPMTSTVEDNARLLQVIAGSDGVDPRQRDVRVGDYTADLDAGVRGLRIGVLREGFGQPGGEPDVDAQVRQAATVLEKLGATVEEVSVPLHLLGPALWTPIAIEGLTETVLRNQGFGISRDDYYPVDMMEHLLRRRGDVDVLPPNVKLFTLLGATSTRSLGRTYYGKAVNRVRTLRAAYDAALRGRRRPADADHAAEGAAAARPGRRRRRVVPPGDGDVRQHLPVRRHAPPGAQPAVRDVRRTPGRADAGRPALRRGHPVPRRSCLRARLRSRRPTERRATPDDPTPRSAAAIAMAPPACVASVM